jgi:hypothetical protein
MSTHDEAPYDASPAAEPDEPMPGLPLSVASEVQDHLLAACNDLERLQVLLADAFHVLMDSFHGASVELSQHRRRSSERELATVLAHVQVELGNAATALQFHDMSTQLIEHTHRRLRSCADQVAASIFPDDEDGSAVIEKAPERPNPVTQSEMNAGSIELF